MAFQVKIGSLTIVTRSASEAVRTFDMFRDSDEPCLVADMNGIPVDIDDLRDLVAEVKGTASPRERFL